MEENMNENNTSIKDIALFTELTNDEQARLVGGACKVKLKNGTVITGSICELKKNGTVVVKSVGDHTKTVIGTIIF